MNYKNHYIDLKLVGDWGRTESELSKFMLQYLVERFLENKLDKEKEELVAATLIKHKILIPIKSKDCGNCDCTTNEQCKLKPQGTGQLTDKETAKQVEA